QELIKKQELSKIQELSKKQDQDKIQELSKNQELNKNQELSKKQDQDKIHELNKKQEESLKERRTKIQSLKEVPLLPCPIYTKLYLPEIFKKMIKLYNSLLTVYRFNKDKGLNTIFIKSLKSIEDMCNFKVSQSFIEQLYYISRECFIFRKVKIQHFSKYVDSFTFECLKDKNYFNQSVYKYYRNTYKNNEIIPRKSLFEKEIDKSIIFENKIEENIKDIKKEIDKSIIFENKTEVKEFIDFEKEIDKRNINSNNKIEENIKDMDQTDKRNINSFNKIEENIKDMDQTDKRNINSFNKIDENIKDIDQTDKSIINSFNKIEENSKLNSITQIENLKNKSKNIFLKIPDFSENRNLEKSENKNLEDIKSANKNIKSENLEIKLLSQKTKDILERIQEKERKRRESFIKQCSDDDLLKEIKYKIDTYFSTTNKKSVPIEDIISVLCIFQGYSVLLKLCSKFQDIYFIKEIQGIEYLIKKK
ncbi:hypothetical protein CWI39_2845p0010, partial [Hamiltosporidium magnivora]